MSNTYQNKRKCRQCNGLAILIEYIEGTTIVIPKQKCEHDWSFAPYMLTSYPPQQDKICRKCGLEVRETIGSFQRNDYSDIINKFKENNKLDNEVK